MRVLGAGPNGLWPSGLTGQRGGSSPSLRGSQSTPWGIWDEVGDCLLSSVGAGATSVFLAMESPG